MFSGHVLERKSLQALPSNVPEQHENLGLKVPSIKHPVQNAAEVRIHMKSER
jgi:hypothetical protein